MQNFKEYCTHESSRGMDQKMNLWQPKDGGKLQHVYLVVDQGDWKEHDRILLFAWSLYKSILFTFNYQELCHVTSISCKGERPCIQLQFYYFGRNGNKCFMNSEYAELKLTGFVHFPCSLVNVYSIYFEALLFRCIQVQKCIHIFELIIL